MSVEHCGTYGRLAILEMCTTLQTKDGQVRGESFCVLISHLCTILTHPPRSSNSLPPPSSSAQGMIAEMVSQLFEIEHGYFGNILSNLAKVWKMHHPIGVTFPRHFIDIPPSSPFLHLSFTWQVQRRNQTRSTWHPGQRHAVGTGSPTHPSPRTLTKSCSTTNTYM